ncbi:DUF1045 domain-containing protein [Thalassococcus lentus]|uniref:DUF1045 domain-containing protein n=1 Tax=Thalassococcus lentus TaxID=1210524 RepID=A0ABT4XP37_9RHOB|nr:DUF1045 domain-containing protein [Thalassococcus lentus]MDA7423716.1 DUF1045 domain-containing protein [Thalassococcus lentus]
MSYSRFALYYVFPDGALAEFGSAWLGWDIAQGRQANQFDLAGLPDATTAPRKYGFHGTLKPPFRLVNGCTAQDLQAAVAELAERCPMAECEGLQLSVLGRFLALTPLGDTAAVQRVAETCVRDLDHFRAPATEHEIARRMKAGLSERQRSQLLQWGYPYVMEDFRFHITLTARLPKKEIATWVEAVEHHLPKLPAPFTLSEIALCGEREDGRFEVIQRYALGG